jgi:predicted metal-dependent hydrolase
LEAVSLETARRVIWVDYQITRRKRYHAVKDEQGNWLFESRLFWECVEYLHREGFEEYEVRAGGRSRLDQVQALAVKRKV